jgi:hemoglobin/transferrin/lactoferrin receptor protein
MKKIYSIIALAIGFCMSSFAQNIVDSTKNISLNEVVISANKFAENKKNIAQQIQVIKRQELILQNNQSMAHVIENSGIAFVQKSQGGGGSPVIRGFEANKILLVIDGVRMNNLIFRGGHLQNILAVDNNMLDRVEILSGPSSTVYGSDALGGVISMYTIKPKFSTTPRKTLVSGNALIRMSSATKESAIHADVSFGGQKFASLTSISFNNFQDLRMGSTKNPFYDKFGERNFYVERINGKDSMLTNSNPLIQKQSGYLQYDVMQKFLFKTGEKITHQINFQFSNTNNVPRYDRLTETKSNGIASNAVWYYGPQTRGMVAYNLSGTSNSKAFDKVNFALNYQYVQESRHNRGFGSKYQNNRYEFVNVGGLQLDFEKKIRKHEFRYGIDIQYSTVRSRANRQSVVDSTFEQQSTRYPKGKNHMFTPALYISHIHKVSDKFILSRGLRIGYSILRSTFDDTVFYKFPVNEIKQNNFLISGNIGAVYTHNDKTKLSAMFSTGFRTPNVDDLSKVFETNSSSVILPSNNLKPEKTLNLDLSLSKVFGGIVKWENTVYGTYIIDAIVTSNAQYNGQDSILYDGRISQVLTNQNKGKAMILGFTSLLNVQCGKYVNVYGSINYSAGNIINKGDNPVPLDHISPAFGRIGVRYTSKKIQADVYSIYNGWKRIKRYNPNGEDNQQYATKDGMPAWFTMNAKISFNINEFISLQAGVENMFDTQYRTFSSGINGAGVNIFGAVRVHW